MTVTRLTIFNARRGGEPARLLIKEWNIAQRREWISEQGMSSACDEDRGLLKSLSLAYLSGKGSRDMVPLLIPDDTRAAAMKLIDVRERWEWPRTISMFSFIHQARRITFLVAPTVIYGLLN